MSLQAIDPERLPSQYIRHRWDRSNGFPGGAVYSITQAADGYLWIAGEKGLVRFDGLTYRLIQPTDVALGTDPVALEIAPDSGGSLWARLRRATLVRYRDGAFADVLTGQDVANSMVTAMSPGPGGTVLVADQSRGLIVSRGDGFDTIMTAEALPRSYVTAIAQTSDGDIWLGTREAGLVRVHGSHATRVTEDLPDQKINCLVPDGPDQLWIGTDNGVVRWDGRAVARSRLKGAPARIRATALVRDRDGNVWVGTPDGLGRINSSGFTWIDHLGAASGVTALFEDRDGNLWVGTTSGIERWRDAAVTDYPQVRSVTTGDAGPIFVDAERVWFAPSSGGLYWLRDGRVGRVTQWGLADDVVYSIAGSGDDLWLGRQRGGLTHVRTRGDALTAETFRQADGLAQDNVYAVHRARDGGVWAGTLSGGASHLKDGGFRTYTTADGLASNTIACVLEISDGSVWFATPNGVSVKSADRWRQHSTANGLPSNDVNTLFEDSERNVWVGTAAGLALVRDDRVQSDLPLPASLRASILGIGEDGGGGLWIASADRVLRVDRKRLLFGSLGNDGVREFGPADGLLSVEAVKRNRSLTSDSRGRIWLSTKGGLAMVDSARVVGRSVPALVQIEALSADGSVLNRAGDITIPPHRQRIVLAFNGLSLSVPERVRFQYRLDGFDSDWSEPVSGRQAVYTNLRPGSYRFRVIASNADGVWNSAEAALSFTLEPAWWQTAWFWPAAALLLTAAVWGAHRVHVAGVARTLNLRYEERLAERARIARDLHDTLLQSFHGVLLRFQSVTYLLPDHPAEARETLQRAIDQAAEAITEGRDTVQGLRSSTLVATDLARAISTLGQELAVAHDNGRSPNFRVDVEGTPRTLAPLLGDEVYRIAGEALRNAFRHAHASQIEVEIRYDHKQFRLRVRDNGKGMQPDVFDGGGQAGHFGLDGMQERAKLVGGTLTVWSERDSGTEGELTIPASVAYARSPVDQTVLSSTGM